MPDAILLNHGGGIETVAGTAHYTYFSGDTDFAEIAWKYDKPDSGHTATVSVEVVLTSTHVVYRDVLYFDTGTLPPAVYSGRAYVILQSDDGNSCEIQFTDDFSALDIWSSSPGGTYRGAFTYVGSVSAG